MSRKNRRDSGDKKKLPHFVPSFRETLKSPAYLQLTFGARALLTALCGRCFGNNSLQTSNGRVYLSARDAGEELGHKSRNDVANWFRELQHYGFIVQTKGASLGVDGKGKSPHWRITDLPTRNADGGLDPGTRDFLRWDGVLFERHVRPSRRWNARKEAALKKQNPGRHVGATVGGTSVPVPGGTSEPPEAESGGNVPPISLHPSGGNVPPISRLPLGVLSVGAGSGLSIEEQDHDGAGRPKASRRAQEPVHPEHHDDLDSEHGMITIEVDGVLIELPVEAA
jgi:hypothetical protein